MITSVQNPRKMLEITEHRESASVQNITTDDGLGLTLPPGSQSPTDSLFHDEDLGGFGCNQKQDEDCFEIFPGVVHKLDGSQKRTSEEAFIDEPSHSAAPAAKRPQLGNKGCLSIAAELLGGNRGPQAFLSSHSLASKLSSGSASTAVQDRFALGQADVAHHMAVEELSCGKSNANHVSPYGLVDYRPSAPSLHSRLADVSSETLRNRLSNSRRRVNVLTMERNRYRDALLKYTSIDPKTGKLGIHGLESELSTLRRVCSTQQQRAKQHKADIAEWTGKYVNVARAHNSLIRDYQRLCHEQPLVEGEVVTSLGDWKTRYSQLGRAFNDLLAAYLPLQHSQGINPFLTSIPPFSLPTPSSSRPSPAPAPAPASTSPSATPSATQSAVLPATSSATPEEDPKMLGQNHSLIDPAYNALFDPPCNHEPQGRDVMHFNVDLHLTDSKDEGLVASASNNQSFNGQSFDAHALCMQFLKKQGFNGPISKDQSSDTSVSNDQPSNDQSFDTSIDELFDDGSSDILVSSDQLSNNQSSDTPVSNDQASKDQSFDTSIDELFDDGSSDTPVSNNQPSKDQSFDTSIDDLFDDGSSDTPVSNNQPSKDQSFDTPVSIDELFDDGSSDTPVANNQPSKDQSFDIPASITRLFESFDTPASIAQFVDDESFDTPVTNNQPSNDQILNAQANTQAFNAQTSNTQGSDAQVSPPRLGNADFTDMDAYLWSKMQQTSDIWPVPIAKTNPRVTKDDSSKTPRIHEPSPVQVAKTNPRVTKNVSPRTPRTNKTSPTKTTKTKPRVAKNVSSRTPRAQRTSPTRTTNTSPRVTRIIYRFTTTDAPTVTPKPCEVIDLTTDSESSVCTPPLSTPGSQDSTTQESPLTTFHREFRKKKLTWLNESTLNDHDATTKIFEDMNPGFKQNTIKFPLGACYNLVQTHKHVRRNLGGAFAACVPKYNAEDDIVYDAKKKKKKAAKKTPTKASNKTPKKASSKTPKKASKKASKKALNSLIGGFGGYDLNDSEQDGEFELDFDMEGNADINIENNVDSNDYLSEDDVLMMMDDMLGA